LEGFTFVMALGLNMGYYRIKLDADSQKLCTLIFSCGNTRMFTHGYQNRPLQFPEHRINLLQNMKYVHVKSMGLRNCYCDAESDHHL
jgi:hypothetical protein